MEMNVINTKPVREEIYNLKNKSCQEEFRKETAINKEILECFANNLSFETQCRQWKQAFDNIIKKCFRKIRIKQKKTDSETESLLVERLKFKKQLKLLDVEDGTKQILEQKIEQIEIDIGEDIAKENFKVISETVKELGVENLNGSGRRKLWSVLKRKPICRG